MPLRKFFKRHTGVFWCSMWILLPVNMLWHALCCLQEGYFAWKDLMVDMHESLKNTERW